MPDGYGEQPNVRRGSRRDEKDSESGTSRADGPGQPEAAGREKPESTAERRRRRAAFLRELAEARELRARVHPRRARAARLRQAAVRMRTFRW